MRHYVWPEVVFFVSRAPRTMDELCELTDGEPRSIRIALKRLAAEGLVEELREKRKETKWRWMQ